MTTSTLIPFLESLREEGFNLGAEQFVRCHEVLLRLAAEERLPEDPNDWATWIGPLVCSNADEQRRFQVRYEAWLAQQHEITEENGGSTTGNPNRRWRMRIMGIGILTVMGYGLWLLLKLIWGTEIQFQGQVTGEAGSDVIPISGAAVRLDGADVTLVTDAGGIFSFPVESDERGWRFEITATGYDTLLTYYDEEVSKGFIPNFHLGTSRWREIRSTLNQQVNDISVFATGLVDEPAVDNNGLRDLFDGIRDARTRISDIDPESAYDPVLHSSIIDELASLTNLYNDLNNATPGRRIQEAAIDISALENRWPGSGRGTLSFYQANFTFIRYFLIGGPLLFLMGWWARRRFNTPLVLHRQSTTRRPDDLEPVVVERPDEPWYPGAKMRQTIQRMRRHVEQDIQWLDVPATAQASANKAGFFTPVFGTRLVSPEYLALIDRAGFGDHHAQWVERIVEQLRSHGVYVDVFYFDGDPRIVRPADPTKAGIPLRRIAQRFPDHRLMIFSDAERFISPRTGYPEDWLAVLENWEDRALFTPIRPDQWTNREFALAGADLLVLPAGSPGLGAFMDQVEHSQWQLRLSLPNAEPFPETLDDYRTWLSRFSADPAEIEALKPRLRGFLGDDGYNWLCACAVYPELHWDLTLYLGRHVENENLEPLLNEPALLALTRLPWMRYGNIPNWLRQELVDELPPEMLEQVRDTLEVLLETAAPAHTPGFKLDIASGRVRGAKRASEGSLNDYVFLSVMNTRAAGKLWVNAPDALKRLLFPDGNPGLGLRPWLMIVLLLAVSAFGFFIPPPDAEISVTNTSPIPRFSSIQTDHSASPAQTYARSDTTIQAILDRITPETAGSLLDEIRGAAGDDDAATVYVGWLNKVLRDSIPAGPVTSFQAVSGSQLPNYQNAASSADVPVLLIPADAAEPVDVITIDLAESTPVSVEVGALVRFTYSLRPADEILEWEFDDGMGAVGAAPYHRFMTPGAHTVSIPAIGASREIFAGGTTQVPVPDPRVETPACPAGTFFDPRNGGECWRCPEGGARTTSVIVTNSACRVGDRFTPATFMRSLTSSAILPSIDELNVEELNQIPGATNYFTARVKGPPSTMTYEWTWGDGQINSGGVRSGALQFFHVYDAVGEYEVTLAIYNEAGRVEETVTVNIVTQEELDAIKGQQVPQQGPPSNLPVPTQPYIERNGAYFIQIPAGEFSMGSESGDVDERPVHSVRITQPFFLGQTEVTIGQFKRFVEETKYNYDPVACWNGLDDNHPAICVSWEDANAYAGWMGGRLPTEAEWEYAARAGTTTEYFWGANVAEANDFAFYNENTNSPQPVGSKLPNALGLYDTFGNVWEWTADWYSIESYLRDGQASDRGGYYDDPLGQTNDTSGRVIRGGSFNSDAFFLRSTSRDGYMPSFKDRSVGFRLVANPSSRE